MTPDERRLLTDLASRIAQTPPPARDAEAEDFIRKNIGSRPDALYLMTQTVLIQSMALENAQQQIRDLQQRAPQSPYPAASGGGSFLGQAPQYSQQPAQYPPLTQSVSGNSGGGNSGFLHSAVQTAAGVAAGALAFEGIRSLFSHPGFGLGSGGGLGFGGQQGFLGGGGVGAPIKETVINNNYYDSRDGSDNQSDNQSTDDDSSDSDDSSDTADDSSFDDSSSSDDSGS